MDLVAVRALVGRGHLLQALREAKEIAESADHPTDDRIDALLMACRCAAGRELYGESFGYADRALHMAREVGDPHRTALAHLYAGRARLMAGDPGEAEEYLLAFLAMLPQVPDLESQRVTGLYHLAMCCEQTHRWDTAINTYRLAADLYEQSGQRADAGKARQNAAWLMLRTGQVSEAEDHLVHSRLMVANGHHIERANQIVLESLFHYLSHRTDDAMAGAEELLTPGCPGATPWSRCLAAWIACNITLAAEPRHAGIFLRAALKEAPACEDTALMNMITELRSRVESIH